MTIKQRQEFRIRIQKRARRKAEKRVEQLENEGVSREVSRLDKCLRHHGVQRVDLVDPRITRGHVESTL